MVKTSEASKHQRLGNKRVKKRGKRVKRGRQRRLIYIAESEAQTIYFTNNTRIYIGTQSGTKEKTGENNQDT